MKTTQHTPGPYEVESRDSLVISANGGLLSICEVHDHSDTSESHTTEEAEANAEFIVRACNAHNELLEACRMALADESTSSKVAKACYAAIANAGALTPISAQGKE